MSTLTGILASLSTLLKVGGTLWVCVCVVVVVVVGGESQGCFLFGTLEAGVSCNSVYIIVYTEFVVL